MCVPYLQLYNKTSIDYEHLFVTRGPVVKEDGSCPQVPNLSAEGEIFLNTLISSSVYIKLSQVIFMMNMQELLKGGVVPIFMFYRHAKGNSRGPLKFHKQRSFGPTIFTA